jgi:hypothetical protein
MDQRPRARWALKKEIRRRIELKLYIYCGEKGHRTLGCSFSRAIDLAYYIIIASIASLSKPKVKEVEDSSNSEIDKGKDGLSL